MGSMRPPSWTIETDDRKLLLRIEREQLGVR
jgi:hypothetical protein